MLKNKRFGEKKILVSLFTCNSIAFEEITIVSYFSDFYENYFVHLNIM